MGIFSIAIASVIVLSPMIIFYDSSKGVILTVDKKILTKIQLKAILTKTHLLFVKNTVAVFLLVVKVAAPQLGVYIK